MSKEALAFGRLVDGAPVVSFGNDDALGLGRLEVHHIARHELHFWGPAPQGRSTQGDLRS